MSLAADRDATGAEVTFEDVTTGLHAHGFGHLADGRPFAFRVAGHTLFLEVYRPRLSGLVPHEEDVVATARRGIADLDLTDERSLAAAVRDCVAAAVPGAR
jgi:hypothetical protein